MQIKSRQAPRVAGLGKQVLQVLIDFAIMTLLCLAAIVAFLGVQSLIDLIARGAL